MNRRAMFATSALVPVAAAVAGCAWLEQVTGTTTPAAAIQAVFSQVQFVLPLVDALAVGIALAVPALAPAMVLVEKGIAEAGPIFQNSQLTMTVVQAQPIVKQIEGYANAGMTSIVNAVSSTPALAANTALQTRVSQAQTVLGLINTFVNGLTPTIRYGVQAPIILLHS